MIDVHAALALGQHIVIELSDDRRLAGRVAWQKKGLAGIQFDERVDVDTILAKPTKLSGGKSPRLPRLEVKCEAEIQYGGQALLVEICDISQRGAKLHMRFPLARDSRLLLLIPDLGAYKATVRWSRGEAMGVSFDEVLPIIDLMEWIAHLALDCSQ